MRRLGELASLSRSWVRGNFYVTPTLTLPLQGGGELFWGEVNQPTHSLSPSRGMAGSGPGDLLPHPPNSYDPLTLFCDPLILTLSP